MKPGQLENLKEYGSGKGEATIHKVNLKTTLDHIEKERPKRIGKWSMILLLATIGLIASFFISKSVPSENLLACRIALLTSLICFFACFPVSLTGLIFISSSFKKEKYRFRTLSLAGNITMVLASLLLWGSFRIG